MIGFFFLDRFKYALAQKAEEELIITRLCCLHPALTSYQRTRRYLQEAACLGYDYDAVYQFHSAGDLPEALKNLLHD